MKRFYSCHKTDKKFPISSSVNLVQGSLGPVHTNPFSNENGAVLLRIRLSSTLQRWKRSTKTEPFENALQSGAIWKRCFFKTLFSSVDGENDAIWKRWRHQNRHDRAPDHSTVNIQNGRYHVASISRQFRGPRYWNALASSSFEHVHWGHNSVFKTDTALQCGRAKTIRKR